MVDCSYAIDPGRTADGVRRANGYHGGRLQGNVVVGRKRRHAARKRGHAADIDDTERVAPGGRNGLPGSDGRRDRYGSARGWHEVWGAARVQGRRGKRRATGHWPVDRSAVESQ